MHALEPYSDYKESGVPWLGKIPAHWDVRRLGQIGAFSKGRGGTKEDEQCSGIPCIRYGDLYTTHSFFIQKSRSFVSRERAKEYQLVKFGDVLFAASGETIEEIGKSAVNLICSETRCGGDVILFRPHREIEARYLGYATDCRPAAIQKAIMGRGFTVVHIYASQLKRLSLALPSLSEQAAIARFLDHTDQHIRRYIRAKEKLIALLEEQKKAVIQQAVTGQIDVRTGQPYPAYKPSGVEWLGNVPEHWDVQRLKHICRMGYGESLVADARQDGDFPVYGSNGRVGFHNVTNTLAPCIIIGRKGSFGKIRYSSTSVFAIDTTLFIDQRFSFSDIRWLYFLLVWLRLDEISKDSAVPGLNREDAYQHLAPAPPLPEQTAIARFLDEATTEIDQSIVRTRHQIHLLREYRTRLIADVVTGKLDVREAMARLPENDDEEQLEEDGSFVDDLDGNDHTDSDTAENPEMTNEMTA